MDAGHEEKPRDEDHLERAILHQTIDRLLIGELLSYRDMLIQFSFP